MSITYTEVKYGDAFDIMNSCDLDFLGDAFNKVYNNGNVRMDTCRY